MTTSRASNKALRTLLLVNENNTALLAFTVVDEATKEMRVMNKTRSTAATSTIKLARYDKDPVHVDGKLLENMYTRCKIGQSVPSEFSDTIMRIITETDAHPEHAHAERHIK